MESILLALKVVFGLFILMSLGYFLKYIKLCDGHSLGVMNRLVFKVFLPTSLFYNVYTADLAQSVDYKLMLFAVSAIVILVFALFVSVPLIERDRKKAGVMIQGIFRSNFVIFGLPVTISLLGEANSGVSAMLIAVVIPVFNVFAVFTLEYFRGGKLGRGKLISIAKGIASNPLIISSLLGVAMLLLKIDIPKFVLSSVREIGGIATPLSLIVLGASFSFGRLSGNLRQLIFVCLLKLVAIPGVFITAAVLTGFRGAAVVALVSLFGSPTAVSSFTMADQMEGDSELAGQIVVCTTAFSVISLFFLIFILKQLAFF